MTLYANFTAKICSFQGMSVHWKSFMQLVDHDKITRQALKKMPGVTSTYTVQTL